MDRKATGRKIVVFADGTGNAFGTQESNVWRLFQALDQTKDDQLARYIQGVGTSGFRPFALLDGATGLGVPSNVRKLYRFICWNWQPGDEIWMFGFSRGAFTIRTLAGLIASQGLVPARIGADPVSRAEMGRNARAAWRRYRAKTAPAGGRLTIALARAIRNLGLAAWGGLAGHRPYAAIDEEMTRQGRSPGNGRGPRIAFLGLFDTVEAFGVPIEEMRRAVDLLIWPLVFRNREMSAIVDQARHALSLDDERTSFHPVLFDMKREKGRERIREVWFAGVHSDVGGGYPDPSLALVPLLWMIDEIAAMPGGGLRLDPIAVAAFRNGASPFGPLHDSRSGLAVTYRYAPRTVRVDGSHEGPVIHHSVLEKMALGNDLYAPVMLPPAARVLLPQNKAGAAEQFAGLGPVIDGRIQSLLRRAPRLPVADKGYAELAQAAVWWRRVAYFLLVGAFSVIASLPWTAGTLARGIDLVMGTLFGSVGAAPLWATIWRCLSSTGDAISGNLNLVAPTVGGLIPGFVRIYVDALIQEPLTVLAVLLATWGLYRWNAALRDRVADLARCAWFAQSSPPIVPALQPANSARERTIPPPSKAKRTVALRIANVFRAPLFEELHRFASVRIVPIFWTLAMVLVALVVVSRITVTSRSVGGGYCEPSATRSPDPLAVGETRTVAAPFAIDRICWASGIRLERGERYQVQLVERSPWFDKTVVSGLAGFTTRSLVHAIALPLRRHLDADWLQPIARIGLRDTVEFPLKLDGGYEFALPPWNGPEARGDVQSLNGLALLPPEPKAEWTLQDAGQGRTCLFNIGFVSKRISDTDLPLYEKLHRALERLPRAYTSEFVAKSDGELFLFVNDAIFGLPGVPFCNWFYDNNRGTAEVRVRRVPPPDLTTRKAEPSTP